MLFYCGWFAFFFFFPASVPQRLPFTGMNSPSMNCGPRLRHTERTQEWLINECVRNEGWQMKSSKANKIRRQLWQRKWHKVFHKCALIRTFLLCGRRFSFESFIIHLPVQMFMPHRKIPRPILYDQSPVTLFQSTENKKDLPLGIFDAKIGQGIRRSVQLIGCVLFRVGSISHLRLVQNWGSVLARLDP